MQSMVSCSRHRKERSGAGSARRGRRLDKGSREDAAVDLPYHTELLQALIMGSGPHIVPHAITHVRGNLTVKQQRRSGKVRSVSVAGQGSLEWAGRTYSGKPSPATCGGRWRRSPTARRSCCAAGWVSRDAHPIGCGRGPIGPPGFHALGVRPAVSHYRRSPAASRPRTFGKPHVECRELAAQRFVTEVASRPVG